MIYKDEIVEKPKDKAIVKQKNGNYFYYVYRYGKCKYLGREKGYKYEHSSIIGRYIDDSKMYPNQNYYKFFTTEKRELKKELPNFSDTLKVGNNYVIDKLSENTKLKNCLEKTFENYEFILDLASYHLIEGNSVSQHYPNYARNHAIYTKKVISDSTISNFLRDKINDTKIHEFFKSWIKSLNIDGSIYVSYDSTNMPCESYGVELAEFGAAIEDETRTQVNISYVFDQTNGTPLFYKAYSGSVTDVVEVKKMLDKCAQYGLKNSIFILDRGYFSKQNLQKLWKICHGYIMMAKTSSLTVRQAIGKVKKTIEEPLNFISKDEVFGTMIEKKLFKEDLDGEEKYFYIYKRTNIAFEKNEIYRQISEINDDLANSIGNNINEKIISYSKYFDIETSENNLTGFRINNEKCNEIIDNIGYFVIISNLKRTPKEILEIYAKRDSIEKSFRVLKEELDFDTFGVHSTTSLRSKIFITFVSSILRSYYFSLTKKLREKDSKNFTVPAIINTLENIEATRILNEKHRILYKLTRQEKEILRAFSISSNGLENKIFDYEKLS